MKEKTTALMNVKDMFKNTKQIEVIKNTVAKNCSDDEFSMFAHLAKTYNLDPFAKEIWCIKMGSNVTIMASRDGYLKIAQSDPNFEGIQSGAVYAGDDFEFDVANSTIKHKMTSDGDAKVVGAWAICYHKERKPSIAYVRFSEYNKKTSNIWTQYPSAMITKVAEVIVLKKQFGINGLLTQEEMGEEYQRPITAKSAHEQVEERKATAERKQTKEEVKEELEEDKEVIEGEVEEAVEEEKINKGHIEDFNLAFEKMWQALQKSDPDKYPDAKRESFRTQTINRFTEDKETIENCTNDEADMIILKMEGLMDKCTEEAKEKEEKEEEKESFACKTCKEKIDQKMHDFCQRMKLEEDYCLAHSGAAMMEASK